ncbi:Tetraspanin-3 [Chamberlinius hualienensis]
MDYDRGYRASFCLHAIFCIIGIILLVCGSILHSQLSQVETFTVENYKIESCFMLTAGCLLTISACLEVIYWCRSTFGQTMLFILHLTFYVLLLSSGIIAIVHSLDVQKTSDVMLNDALNQYGFKNSTTLTNNLDSLQRNLHCCGTHDYTDWTNTTWVLDNQILPPSCCHANNKNTSLTNPCEFYTQGCFEVIQETIYKCDVIIATITFIIFFLMISSSCWSKSCKNQRMEL